MIKNGQNLQILSPSRVGSIFLAILMGGLLFASPAAAADWAESMMESSGIGRAVTGQEPPNELMLRESIADELSRNYVMESSGSAGSFTGLAELYGGTIDLSGGSGDTVLGVPSRGDD